MRSSKTIFFSSFQNIDNKFCEYKNSSANCIIKFCNMKTKYYIYYVGLQVNCELQEIEYASLFTKYAIIDL